VNRPVFWRSRDLQFFEICLRKAKVCLLSIHLT
jgi:hypothetical protein